MSKPQKQESLKSQQHPSYTNKMAQHKVLTESDKKLINNLKNLIKQNWKNRENLRKKKEEETSALSKQEDTLKEHKVNLQNATDNLAAKNLEFEKLIKENPYAARYDGSGKIIAKSQEELVEDLNIFRWKQKLFSYVVAKFQRENELRKTWSPTFPLITFSPVLAFLNLNYYCNTGMRFMFKHLVEPFELKPTESCFDVYHMIKNSEDENIANTAEVSTGTTEESKTNSDNAKPEVIEPYVYDEQRQINYCRFMGSEAFSEDSDSDSEPAEITYTKYSQAEVDNTSMHEVEDHSNTESCCQAEDSITKSPNYIDVQDSVKDHVEGQRKGHLQNKDDSQSDNAKCNQDSDTPRLCQQQNGVKSFSNTTQSIKSSNESKANSKVAKLDMASITINPTFIGRDQCQGRTSLTPVPRRVLKDIRDIRRSNSENNVVLEKSRSSSLEPKVPVKFKEHCFTYPDGTYSKLNKKLYHSPYVSEKIRNRTNHKKIGSVIEYEKDGFKREKESYFTKDKETPSTHVAISSCPSKPVNISKLQGQYVFKPVQKETLGTHLRNEQPKLKTPKRQSFETSYQKCIGLSKFVTDDKFPASTDDEVTKNSKRSKSKNTSACKNAMHVNVLRPFCDSEVPKYASSGQTAVYRRKKISLDDETRKLSCGIKNKPKVLRNLVCVSLPTPERYRSSEFITSSSRARSRSNETFHPTSSREPRKLPLRKQKSIQDIIAILSSE